MKLNPYQQTLFVVWGNQLLTAAMLIFYFHWWSIPLLFISARIVGIFSEMTVHRYYAHKSYAVNSRWKQHLLKVLAFVVGQGATISWVNVHRHHHKFVDQSRDPHSPHHLPWWRIYLGLFTDKYDNMAIDMLRDRDKKYFLFENKYYAVMWAGVWIISFLISPVLFFVIAGGSALWYSFTALINIFLHRDGFIFGRKRYRDAPGVNSRLFDLITGDGLHQNHHYNPTSHTYNLDGFHRDFIGDVIGWFADSVLYKRSGYGRDSVRD